MPLHDWSKQTDEIFHDFHNRWTTRLTDELNNDRLPGNMLARSESGRRTKGLDKPREDPVHRVPDIDTIADPLDSSSGTAVAVADTPPRAAMTLVLSERMARLRRVAIRKGDGQLVAMIEIVSHANVATGQARRLFVDKCQRLLSARVHLAVLDLHPRRGRLLPIEELLARDFGFEDASARREGQALVSSVCATPDPVAYFAPLSPGDPLPLPLYSSRATATSRCRLKRRIRRLLRGHLAR